MGLVDGEAVAAFRAPKEGGQHRELGRSPIEAARERHHLIDVANRTGIVVGGMAGSVTVRCPMPAHGHFDRTPSLRLHLDAGIFHCFGCGRQGDVVEWVEQTEGVGWREAIRILDSGARLTNAWQRVSINLGRNAARYSISAPASSTATGLPDLSRTPRDRVYGALASAWLVYTRSELRQRGTTYLAGRGIDVVVLEDFNGRREVGHTPARADGLVSALRSEGFTASELVDAGLAYRRSDGRVVDFYRERVLIPIRDDSDQVCGLIGRNVGDARWPKYKNPPLTHAYDKSVNLYQPLRTPTSGSSGRAVVVEGTIDAMAIAVAAIQAGRATEFCPVTQSGRELSSYQLDYIMRQCPPPPIIGFDADSAGRESSTRVAAAAALAGTHAVVARLPEGEDPASWFATHGPAGLDAWAGEGALGSTSLGAGWHPAPTEHVVIGRDVESVPQQGPTPCWPSHDMWPPARTSVPTPSDLSVGPSV